MLGPYRLVAMLMPVVLHLLVTLRTQRHCFLAHSDLREVDSKGIGYAYAWETVPALTSDPAYPATLFPGPFGSGNKVFTMPMSGEPVPALTSDPAYPAILFPEPFDAVI